MSQLSLELEPRDVSLNAGFFDAEGRPRRLMWCSDSTRIAWRLGVDRGCPYTEPRWSRSEDGLIPPIGLRHRPGPCCMTLEPRGRADGE